MKLHITCKEATDRISRKEEGRLSMVQRVQLWLHLATCSLCRLFNKQNRIITGSARKSGQFADARLSDADKAAIAGRLNNDQP